MESSAQSGTGPSGRDARRHPRFKLEVDVKINSKTSGILQGRTVDISESGLSAMLKIEVPVGEMVELQFTLADAAVTIYAMVRHRNAFRYGFQFVESSPATELIQAACRGFEADQPSSS